MKNRTRFVKLINGKIQQAPSTIVIDGNLVYNPNERILRTLGYKKYIDIRPECENGFYAEFAEYSEDDMTITVIYQVKEITLSVVQESELA